MTISAFYLELFVKKIVLFYKKKIFETKNLTKNKYFQQKESILLTGAVTITKKKIKNKFGFI